MLQAKGIHFQYHESGQQILQGVDLTLRPGERLGVAAPSGFGKTTLCKILAGYERAERGEILVDGAPLESFRGHCPVQMIWQHPEGVVNPRMRMRDILAEGGVVLPHVIAGLGIEQGWLSRFPTELSGGELQRFCIARALGEGTKYLLADEISTMLDLITQAQIWRFLLEETQRRKMGLLVVSHDEGLMERVCGGNVVEMAAVQ